MQQILHQLGPSMRSCILGKSFVSVTIHLYIQDGSYVGMWALYEVSPFLCIHLNILSTGRHLLNGRPQNYNSL